MVASGVFARVVGEGDPFRGTLMVLPLVVAALRAIERHAVIRRRGRWAQLEGMTLIVLVVATLSRQRFGLVVTDWFLIAGFFLLLFHRTAHLVVGLRPSLGWRLPNRPPLVFFWLPLVVYLAIQPWSSAHRQPDGDEPYYLLLAHSLAYELDVDLADNYAEDWQRFMQRAISPQPGDPVGENGEQYSRHGFILPLLLAPAYRLAGRSGAMAMMAVLTAALAWMLLRLAARTEPDRPGAALLAYGLFAFSPPLLLYSYQIWVEVPAALLTAWAFDRILALKQRPRWDARALVLLVIPIALLPILKLRFGLVAGPLLALACWRLRPGAGGAGAIGGSLGRGGRGPRAVQRRSFRQSPAAVLLE